MDLAGVTELKDIQSGLAARARDGWDPDEIMRQTRISIAETLVVNEWARQAGPRIDFVG